MLTTPSHPSTRQSLPSSASTPLRAASRARADSHTPFSIENVDLQFILGVRSMQQLKCACRRQFPRDPRRSTALFAALKDAFDEYKSVALNDMPERYRPFFADLRRGIH